ncbi:hypothetical protein ACA040_004638 [Xenophilus aerolatus]
MSRIAMLALLAASSGLAGCVSPTPSRAAGTDGIRFGYSSTKLSDQLYRVRIVSTGRTPVRWVDAFLLYRAAEVARQADAPAFRIVEGNVDTSVLAGEDLYDPQVLDLDAALTVSRVSRPSVRHGDVLVGRAPSADGMRRTAGAMPVFRMPPPALPKYQPPVDIYTPGYGPVPLPDRTLIVELRPDLQGIDDKSFVTADVLGRLGPRIKRAAREDAAPKPAAAMAL